MAFSDLELRRIIGDSIFWPSLMSSSFPPPESGSVGMMPDLEERHLAMPDLEGLEGRTFLRMNPLLDESQIGRSSFDFRLGRRIAWCDGMLGEVTEKDLKEMPHKDLEDGEPFEFRRYDMEGRIYYVESYERVEHSDDLEVEVHSKSTTGRVGCQAKGVGRTSDGRLITLLQPLRFNLVGRCGKTQFAQGIVRYRGTLLMTMEEILKGEVVSFENGGVSLKDVLTPRGMKIRYNIRKVYQSLDTDEPIDMDAEEETLDWTRWFREIQGNLRLRLEKNTLYLLGSLGVIGLRGVCGIISKEQEAFNGVGGFGCLAGVIQDGFKGQITMEPYCPLAPVVIRRGDVAGYVLFERVEGERVSEDYGGDYQGQKAPRLPKMFKVED